MDDHRIKRIAIVGGGTAGWVAASVLARTAPEHGCAITVIESPDIGTIGVGEATIPPIMDLIRYLNIDEADFVRHTQSTFKLGIKFQDWKRAGHTYWHPFGTCGATLNRRPFYHYWQRAEAQGVTPRMIDYSVCAALGDAGKFQFPDASGKSAGAGIRYALHFDAGLVAKYLRTYAERLGVTRLERTVKMATVRDDGFIDELVFDDASRLKADLYLDCSGFRGLLIEQTLATGYVNWSDLLPCDRAVAMPTEISGPRAPYTLSRARPAGWQWRIPLQHRAGNGYVYSSAHISDDAARADLIATVGEKALAEPRVLRFVTGRRKLFWVRNCIALGLASGFLEPLESTSIQLVINGVYNLMDHFPDLTFDQRNIDSYNRELIDEIETVRDFIVLHYAAVERDDSPLWQHCRAMPLPDSLKERIELYRGTGRIRPKPRDLFTDLSWFYILDGLGVKPRSHDPLVDGTYDGQVRQFMDRFRSDVAAFERTAPTHDSWFAPGSALSSTAVSSRLAS